MRFDAEAEECRIRRDEPALHRVAAQRQTGGSKAFVLEQAVGISIAECGLGNPPGLIFQDFHIRVELNGRSSARVE
jgi:hypothetical protein